MKWRQEKTHLIDRDEINSGFDSIMLKFTVVYLYSGIEIGRRRCGHWDGDPTVWQGVLELE